MGAINIRLPNITAGDPSVQMAQMQSYLYQMVEQLNWALNTVESASNGDTQNVALVGDKSIEALSEQEAQNTFNAVKSLIIKSADIVSAYYEGWKKEFAGEYCAESDFGTYWEDTLATIEANSKGVTQYYEMTETIKNETGYPLEETIPTLVKTNAWIKTGNLQHIADNVGDYGMEVGEVKEADGEEVYNRFARFTSDGIYFFYPGNNSPVYWMGNNMLYIANAEISGNLKLGSYTIDTSNGLAFKWTAREG